MNNFEIRELSTEFYMKYPVAQYKEITHKLNRPYDVVIFESKYEFKICIPFRSHINHQQCYHFKLSERSLYKKSGLDYSKIIIIKNSIYIGKYAVIDSAEAKELIKNSNRIHHHAQKFVQSYINHFKGIHRLNEKEFSRKFRYSTLPYFHDEMGL